MHAIESVTRLEVENSSLVACLPALAPRLLVISPAKDEGRYIARTIATLSAQTYLPTKWIIVNDGSTDGTRAIADEASRTYPWIQVLHRPQGARRRVGPGVIEAFCAGLDQARLSDYDFICKLDADLELPPTYFEELMRRFAADSRLGTATGGPASRQMETPAEGGGRGSVGAVVA